MKLREKRRDRLYNSLEKRFKAGEKIQELKKELKRTTRNKSRINERKEIRKKIWNEEKIKKFHDRRVDREIDKEIKKIKEKVKFDNKVLEIREYKGEIVIKGFSPYFRKEEEKTKFMTRIELEDIDRLKLYYQEDIEVYRDKISKENQIL